jgi:hypothetical protein
MSQFGQAFLLLARTQWLLTPWLGLLSYPLLDLFNAFFKPSIGAGRVEFTDEMHD